MTGPVRGSLQRANVRRVDAESLPAAQSLQTEAPAAEYLPAREGN
jgi:hypothetical protein